MPRRPGAAYDSFVVRVWQEAGSGRLLRGEVEHVQTGAVHVGRGIDSSWILDVLDTCLRGRPTAGGLLDEHGNRLRKERTNASDASR